MEEVQRMLAHTFEKRILNEIRDICVFCGFTGLAYEEVHSLRQPDIITGHDGKLWIDKSRLKTGGDEAVPLLPICLELLEKYKNHPVCQRTGQLLPVPANQTINKGLKEIGQILRIVLLKDSHQWRYFFANEVAFNNGMDLKTVGNILSHESLATTQIYVKGNRSKISKSMDNVEEILFNKDGSLKSSDELSRKNKEKGQSNRHETQSETKNKTGDDKEAGAKIIQMTFK